MLRRAADARTFEGRFGPVTIRRTRGWCRRCHKWRFPADAVLGLEETAGYSPSVQEMVALAVSELPVAEATAVVERLTGVKLPRATLDRVARRQGARAQAQRDRLDRQMQTPEGCAQQVRELQMELPLQPFTLVVELDAWNIRERDQRGESAVRRAAGEEPSRRHWVYGGTCFRLTMPGATSCNAKSTFWTASATGWTTWPVARTASRWAAARWNQPVANTNAVLDAPADF